MYLSNTILKYRITPNYFIVLSCTGEKRGLTIFKRFKNKSAEEILVFEDNVEQTTITEGFALFINKNENLVSVIGTNSLHENYLIKSEFKLHKPKITVKNAKEYNNKEINFEVLFMNGDILPLNFNMVHYTEEEQDTKSFFHSNILIFLKLLLTILSICIFIFMGIVIKYTRTKKGADVNPELVSERSSRVEDIINTRYLSVGEL